MSQFKVGDIVLYDPPDLNAQDYSKRFLQAVGIVTDEPAGNPRRPPMADETHVNWISVPTPDLPPNPLKHYTKNLRKLGHVTEVSDGEV